MGYNLKILIWWWEELVFDGKNKNLVGGVYLGEMNTFLASGGTPPILPVGKTVRGESKIKKKKWKEKIGGLKKIYIKQIKCKYPFCAASYVRSFCRWQYYILLMSYYTHFIHTINLIKWFENDYFPMMPWLQHNGEVLWKRFIVQN